MRKEEQDALDVAAKNKQFNVKRIETFDAEELVVPIEDLLKMPEMNFSEQLALIQDGNSVIPEEEEA